MYSGPGLDYNRIIYFLEFEDLWMPTAGKKGYFNLEPGKSCSCRKKVNSSLFFPSSSVHSVHAVIYFSETEERSSAGSRGLYNSGYWSNNSLHFPLSCFPSFSSFYRRLSFSLPSPSLPLWHEFKPSRIIRESRASLLCLWGFPPLGYITIFP